MFFGDIVGNIIGTRILKEPKLELSFAAAEPVVLHVRGFGFTFDYGVVINTN